MRVQNNINLGAIEVLIADDNCTEGTVDVVQAFRERLQIRRATENRQGLTQQGSGEDAAARRPVGRNRLKSQRPSSIEAN
jgi:hypothetical protein